jgi:FtsP/CotA-like multicopper oxidase with cupredoxin domain
MFAHTAFWEAEDLSCSHSVPTGQPTFSVEVMPSNTFVLDMNATTTGSWVFYCNIFDHYTSGMSARMVIS